MKCAVCQRTFDLPAFPFLPPHTVFSDVCPPCDGDFRQAVRNLGPQVIEEARKIQALKMGIPTVPQVKEATNGNR